MSYRKVIFLDVDGVLAPHRAPGEDAGLDTSCCRRLYDIVASTNCDIVVSAAWRYMGYGRNSVFGQCLRSVMLFEYERDIVMSAVVGACPLEPQDEPPVPRNVLISTWVAEHKPERWVALDDLDDIRKLPDGHWVQTDGAIGLTDADAERVIELLGGEA